MILAWSQQYYLRWLLNVKYFEVLKVVAMATLPRGKAGRTMNEKVL